MPKGLYKRRPLFIKECANCGIKIKSIVNNKKYCSNKCKKSFLYGKNRFKHCRYCEKEFKDDSPKNGNKYCSQICRTHAATARKFNITNEDHAFLETVNKCEICESPFKNKTDKHIDHCHETSIVRGVLCHRCNTALGIFGDNKEGLEKAYKYLCQNRILDYTGDGIGWVPYDE